MRIVRDGTTLELDLHGGSRRASARETVAVEEGDAIYHDAVGALFSGADGGVPDPLEVMKWKELFDKLEDTLDECEDVANVLESISIKNS